MPKEEQAHITRPGRANARILAELEFALHLSEAENGKYDAALEEALDYLLEKQQTEGVLTDQACEEAEEILEPIAEEAKSYELILAAHAHIDMNWMWSFNETVSIVLATFRSILNIMDQYPEFCFSQSQASVYKIVEEYDPELMERIKARIAEGRWGSNRLCMGRDRQKYALRRVSAASYPVHERISVQGLGRKGFLIWISPQIPSDTAQTCRKSISSAA